MGCVLHIRATTVCILTLTVGNANELNAAYAADGYSRVKGCPGVCELPLHPLAPILLAYFTDSSGQY
jgi:hypothetical protein